MTREVMQQALEALENAVRYHGIMLMADPPQDAWKYHRVEDNAKQAITALREALAQPEQEQQIETLKRCLFQMQEAAKNLVEQEKSLTPPQRTEQEPTPWRDMVVVSLVREGINKHKARELADHFVNFTLTPALPEQEPCIGKDPLCPCQDGDACHYKDCKGTKAWPVPQAEPVSCRFCHDARGCWTWQCYKCGEIDDVQQPAAQPVQEPVAWAVQACSKMWRGEFAEIDAKAEAKRIGGTCVAFALYTEPPQRPWQGLTEFQFAEIYNKWNDTNGSTPWGLYHVIEKALKAKNHG